MLSIFGLQVHFRYTLSILHLKTDIKTHFRLNIKKCALCSSSTSNKVEFEFLYQQVTSYLSVNMLIDFDYT